MLLKVEEENMCILCVLFSGCFCDFVLFFFFFRLMRLGDDLDIICVGVTRLPFIIPFYYDDTPPLFFESNQVIMLR